MLERLARFCFRRRWLVLVSWLVGSLGVVTVAGMASPDFSADYRLDGSDSQRAYDVLARHFPDQSGGVGQIVFRAPAGLAEAQTRQQVEDVLAKVRRADPVVVAVTSPYDAAAPMPLSADGRTGVAMVQFSTADSEVPYAVRGELRDLAAEENTDRLQVELSGRMFAPVPSTGLSESVGLIAAVVILLIAFGSLLMAGMPLLVAIAGLFTSAGVIMLGAKVVDVPDFALSTAAMIVLGVGVDYALFIATRAATNVRAGMTPEDAVVGAAGTAGRAVVFAGLTVVISLGGMLAMGIGFVQALAVGCALGVLLTMLVAITLLPALLGFAGPRILPRRWRTPPAGADDGALGGRGFARWSDAISRRAAPVALLVTAVLVILALPTFAMRLGSSDAGNSPTGETTRRAFDILTEVYGAGATAPLQVVVDLRGSDPEVADRVAGSLPAVPGVAQVSPPVRSADGRAALVNVVPVGNAQDERTIALIDDLRTDVLPETVAGTAARVHVGGVTASFQDLADRLASRLPIFIFAVLGLSFVLLVVAFRALLAPLQAVVMTLFSLGIAYAVLVAVFQWGWLASLIGVGRAGPLESYTPMTLMALLFGLSMDYQVFLLSRVKEALHRTGDHRAALREAMRGSGRVIMAAAFIMAAVFASFILSPDRILKQFGLGLSVAVLIEAAIVLTLTPALLSLSRHRAWTLPGWLAWLPNANVEGSPAAAPQPALSPHP